MRESKSEWRDGFLFVGHDLALDFLNTRPALAGGETELLDSWPSVVRWGVAAGLIECSQQARLIHRFSEEPRAAQKLVELRSFRDDLRAAILRLEREAGITEAFVERINELSRKHPMYWELLRSPGKLERVRRFDPRTTQDLYAPLVEAVSGLLANEDPTRVRKCQNESCVLHFRDTSKNATRSWCSMQLCGNREKVSAYARRKRTARFRVK